MKKILLCVLLASGCAAAFAQAPWPSKVVRIVVPFAPGALTDVAARSIALELSEQLGQQFVVENKGGAGGTLGAADVAKSVPDGHTLVFTDNSYMISASLYPKLPYDPLKDLIPVTLAIDSPAIMVAKLELPAKSLREMLDLAKAKPRTLTFGSGGQGSSAHLATELLFNQAGVELVHVPFKGVAAALAETVGGRIDVTISSARERAATSVSAPGANGTTIRTTLLGQGACARTVVAAPSRSASSTAPTKRALDCFIKHIL